MSETDYTQDADIIAVDEISAVKGLYYIEDIKEDTSDIISLLDTQIWSHLPNSTGRLVQHYGYKYNYINKNIREKCAELPTFLTKFQNILTEVCIQLNLIDENYEFNQCIINNYYFNEGISAHTDVKSYGKVIGCLTVGAGTTVKFTNDDQRTYEIYVEPNSMYIMTQDARYKWYHSIPVRKQDIVDNKIIERGRRISITFRNVPQL
jgi:alkylated DNA repair dioxygenase AlkB